MLFGASMTAFIISSSVRKRRVVNPIRCLMSSTMRSRLSSGLLGFEGSSVVLHVARSLCLVVRS